MQVIEKLAGFFRDELGSVITARVASALFNDDGFAALYNAMPEKTFQRYLIGIDLPTTVGVLRTIQGKLLEGVFEAKLYKTDGVNFHPKVYWLGYGDGSMKAVIGSANLTSGGLQN